MIIRPMLGASLPENVTPEQLDKLVPYPVGATLKFDGIRCERVDDTAFSGRNFKHLPNQFIHASIVNEIEDYELDGEILTYSSGLVDDFNTVQSKVMTRAGTPDFKYHVFDFMNPGLRTPYVDRIDALEHIKLPTFCQKEIPEIIENTEQLLDYERRAIEKSDRFREGHEGVMLRTFTSPYKCGRSTLREFYLVKLVRYVYGEAEILEIYEQMTNVNEAETSATGYTVRRKTKDGKVPNGKMGGMLCRDLKSGEEFKVGCGKGMKDGMRRFMWENASDFIGKTIRYKAKPYGMKNKPRHPVWHGFINMEFN